MNYELTSFGLLRMIHSIYSMLSQVKYQSVRWLGVVLLFCFFSQATAQEETPASFPGGNNAYNAYLSSNLHYPEAALSSKANRTIKVLVGIDSLGKARIQEFIYKNSGLGFEEAVEQFIAGMPNWIPATHHGIPMESQIILSFNFQYNEGLEASNSNQSEPERISFYETSDVPPFYVHGEDSLRARMKIYLLDSMKLKSVNGSCRFQFIVDVAGNLVNVSIMENSTEVSDRYLQYALENSGRWYCGLIKGKKVNVQTILSLSF